MIDLFVADKEQYKLYKNIVHKDINIIIGQKVLKIYVNSLLIIIQKEQNYYAWIDIEMIKMKNPKF